jgi:hypothetical protein
MCRSVSQNLMDNIVAKLDCYFLVTDFVLHRQCYKQWTNWLPYFPVYGTKTTAQVISVARMLGIEIDLSMINSIPSCCIITPSITSNGTKCSSRKLMVHVIKEYSKCEPQYDIAFAWMRLCVDYNANCVMPNKSFRMKKSWFYKYGPYLPHGTKQILVHIQTMCKFISSAKRLRGTGKDGMVQDREIDCTAQAGAPLHQTIID